MKRIAGPLLALALPLLAAAAETNALNVLLIVSDDLRDTVGFLGNTAVKTPNLDRLAERGVRFTHAYAQYPVCNASRTSFLTGLRPEQTGVVDNKTLFRSVLPDVVTLPQLLRGHGWYAASYGKIFHAGGEKPPERDAWLDLGRSWDEALMFQATPAGRAGKVRDLTGGKLPWCKVGAMEGVDDDQPDGQNAAHAIAAIERQAAAGKPWFIAVGFHRPHDPFLSPRKYFDLYPPGSLTLHRDPADQTPAPPLALPGGGLKQVFDAFTDEERLAFQHAFYAGVSFMDAQVGRLMETLDRQKLWERTVVIFIGDNGYHHNERGWWNKNTLFERSCRVPMLVVAPGAKAGGTCDAPVELVDLYPTVAGFCGVQAPHALAGRSLLPWLKDPARPGRDAAFTMVSHGPRGHGQSVRTERWRFTRWSDGNRELYDERNDPEETHNLAADPAHAETLAGLAARLDTIGPPAKGTR